MKTSNHQKHSRAAATAHSRRLQRMVSSRELIAAISRIQRNIFKLGNKYHVPEDAQSLLDSARETLHAAKVTAEFEAANDKLSD